MSPMQTDKHRAGLGEGVGGPGAVTTPGMGNPRAGGLRVLGPMDPSWAARWWEGARRGLKAAVGTKRLPP